MKIGPIEFLLQHLYNINSWTMALQQKVLQEAGTNDRLF